MNKFILLILTLVFVNAVSAQSQEKILLNKGVEEYKKGNFSSALDFFSNSYAANGTYNKSLFNAANAAILNDSLTLAKDILTEYIAVSENKLDKSKGHYNIGNIQYTEYEKLAKNPEESQKAVKKLKESIESYKKAIRNNPQDLDARHNLSLAMSKVPPPSENQDNQDNKENQDNQDQDKNEKDQENKDGDQKDDENKGDQKKDGDKNEKDGDQPGDKEDDKKEGDQKGNEGKEQDQKDAEEMEGKISRMQATKDLDALNDDEQKTLMKVNQKKTKDQKGTSSSKDW